MIYELLAEDGVTVINTIVADAQFVETHHPGSWRLAAVQPPPELLPRRMAPLAFRRRFTKAERSGIEWAAVDRADQTMEQRQQAAALRSDLKDQAQAQYIDLDDPDTVAGVQALEAIGLIAPGRAAEILGATVLPEELP